MIGNLWDVRGVAKVTITFRYNAKIFFVKQIGTIVKSFDVFSYIRRRNPFGIRKILYAYPKL